MNISYVLPLRRTADMRIDELTGYLRWLSGRAEIVVVDGSPEPIFRRHHEAWSGFSRHERPQADLSFLNGKVNGVTTGVRIASNELVIVADDDVRYEEGSLAEIARRLERADLVWPQNFFYRHPWHARWDTARTLLNRATGTDFPGTVGLRRSTFLRIGGYEGDVLFENLELLRTFRAAGAVVDDARDLFVPRQPPTTRGFLDQRVRQAYDEFARPVRLAAFCALVPAVVGLAARRRLGLLSAAALSTIVLAERGRRVAGGTAVFPPTSALFAPAWVAERAVCSWIALYKRLLLGGCPYGNAIIKRPATPARELRRRFASGRGPAESPLQALERRIRALERRNGSRRRTA